jgi:hypothetical protein
MGNPVIHFEIITSDSSDAQEFYAGLFDWEINADNPLNYGAVKSHSESGIGGGISGPFPGTQETYVTFYVMVGSISETLQKVSDLGGQTAMPEMELPGGMRMAQFIDPYGNRIGLLESKR